MTYNVSSGTLNPTHTWSPFHSLDYDKLTGVRLFSLVMFGKTSKTFYAIGHVRVAQWARRSGISIGPCSLLNTQVR